ncbi:hypothetical protein [Nitrospirillum sp. BR 11828]|uniref:hypothetical protein n=1 Tax=Nitrospirillum sp. BR 11828 TaxID=3104325 RepID=UPI002ACA0373|nr:hypothetical protein [Nitrospirillum sp. BR 11828]MDZ5646569.1 hypothetical protein [Nitrospirillum sp. BR 11828]
MFRKVMGWIAGKGDDAPSPPDAVLPADGAHGGALRGDGGQGHGVADAGRSPVFSSRAVRDAAVVTSTIDTIRRYVAGEEQVEGLVRKLQSLSAEQFGFLQISIDPALTAKAVGRLGDAPGASATTLRHLLSDIGDGGKPAGEGGPAAAPEAASSGPTLSRGEAEMSAAPSPVAPPAPALAGTVSAPLSVPVPPTAAVPTSAVPTSAIPTPGPQPSRTGPLFTALAAKGRDALTRNANPADRAEMRAVPTPTPRVPGALSLRAAPPTPVRASVVGGTLPAQPLSTPSRPAPVHAPVSPVTVPGGARMATTPVAAARVTLHGLKSSPAAPAVAASAVSPPDGPAVAPLAEPLAAPVVVPPPRASSDAPVPPPQPAVARRPAAAVARMPREQADKRRARLLEAIAGEL